MNRPDVALRLAVVAERLPRRLDAARDGGVRDDAPVPDLLDDLVAGHEALAVLDQQRDQREDLWLDAARLAVGTQFEACQVQLEWTEPVEHGSGA